MSALETRLMRFASDPDPRTILGPDALSDAAGLLQAATDLRGATTVVAAVGMLHFLRWIADQDDLEELQVSCMLSAPLLRGHPGLLPEPVRRFLAEERGKKPGPRDNPAKTALRTFLAAKPAGQAAAWPELLWQLSLVLRGRYERTGEAAVLGEAVAVLRHAVAAARPDDPDHAVRRAALSEWLGSSLLDRFVQAGDTDALNEAVRTRRDALRELRPDDPDSGRRALNLAGALLRQFERTRDVSSLNEAIECLKAASAQRDRPVRAALSNNLSVALRERHEILKQQADLDEAIAAGRLAAAEAVSAPERGAAHGTLGLALLRQYLVYAEAGPYNVTGTRFLDEALVYLRLAVADSPAADPHRAVALSNLGIAVLRARAVGDTPELTTEACQAFGEAAEGPAGAPSVRVLAAVTAGRLAADRGDWPAGERYLRKAIGLLDLAVPRGLRRQDREHQLRRLRDLASDAAACAWRNGDCTLAAALFEQGRGVLLAQEIDTPTDRERLRAEDEDLANRFEKLREEVEQAGYADLAAGVSDWSEPTTAERRGELMSEWEQLIARIRQGFPGFLRPPPPDDLQVAAAAGPVVFINVSKYGSAAFLVQASGIAGIGLPDASPAAVRAMVAELLTITSPEAEPALGENLGRLAGVLEWLWDAIAGPVLDRLGFTAPLGPEASGPRVWWCPSGLLSFLPLHAAGHHGTRGDAVPRTVMDRVISSYIPTIQMLRHTRRLPLSAGGPTLVVAPESGLPGAAAEATMLGAITPVELLAGPDATPEVVLSALREHGRVHFAGHACSDLEDPSRSYLALDGGTPLPVSSVAASRLTSAEFAFLSACSTYQPGPVLADEAIHLGSAFQLAGFPQVIATLWPVVDTPPTRRLTEKVYRDIAGPAGLARAGAALHRAVRDERDRAPDTPQLWAAHVHSGA